MSCVCFCLKVIKMVWKYDIIFYVIKLENDGVNFEEFLDLYFVFCKVLEDFIVFD